jgi:hypothetical protein
MAFVVENSRERGGISQHTHATRERVGNAHRADFRFLTLWSSEVFIDRLREQGEPPFEMRLLHRKNGVLWKWRALIIAAPEKQGLPKAVHRRQMRRPIHVRGFVEDRGEQLVAVNFRVESIDESFHILRRFDIAEGIHEVK